MKMTKTSAQAAFFGVLRSRGLQLGLHEALKKATGSIARRLFDEDFMARPENIEKLLGEAKGAYSLIENREDLGAGIERGRRHLKGLIGLAEDLELLVKVKAVHITTFKVFSGHQPPLITADSFLTELAQLNARIMLARIAMVAACFNFEFHIERPFSQDEPDSGAKLILGKKIVELWRQQDIVEGFTLTELPSSSEIPESIANISFILRRDLVGIVGLKLRLPDPAAGNDNSGPGKVN
jgi:hypothetical protein